MSIFNDIEKLITEHGSATILREKVGLLELQRNQAILDRDNAIGERDKLSIQLGRANERIANLESRLANLNPNKAIPRNQRDKCPHCHQERGQLAHSRPDIRGGFHIETYHCEGCGENYEKHK